MASKAGSIAEVMSSTMRSQRALVLGCLIVATAMVAKTSDGQSPQSSAFTGRVFVDTIMRPLAGVEVTLPTLSRSTLTDEKGAFRIADIPPGIHRVRARRIGYAMFDASITFREGETIERPIVLPRLTTLDTVVVVGETTVPLSFLEHRAVGLGYFLTRADLEKNGGRHLSEVLYQGRGVAMILGRSGEGWILSKRPTASIRSISPPPRPAGGRMNESGEPVYYPDESEKLRGMKAGCYPHVYLDRTLLNPRTPAEPVDINAFGPEQLEAIEWFAGPAQTPMEYSKLNSGCGVLVLHTRRSK